MHSLLRLNAVSLDYQEQWLSISLILDIYFYPYIHAFYINIEKKTNILMK